MTTSARASTPILAAELLVLALLAWLAVPAVASLLAAAGAFGAGHRLSARPRRGVDSGRQINAY